MEVQGHCNGVGTWWTGKAQTNGIYYAKSSWSLDRWKIVMLEILFSEGFLESVDDSGQNGEHIDCF